MKTSGIEIERKANEIRKGDVRKSNDEAFGWLNERKVEKVINSSTRRRFWWGRGESGHNKITSRVA